MTPPTVNAYYNPSANEIVFPAGILQAPQFDAAADDAANYGPIGAGNGPEILHGFYDQGAQDDGPGVFAGLWADEDREDLVAKSAAPAAQDEQYEPPPRPH